MGEIGGRSSTIRRDDGVVMFVSNNQVLGNRILVYNTSRKRKARFDIAVRADVDLDEVTQVLSTAIASVDDVDDDPAPSAQPAEVTNNTVNLSISYWYPSSTSGSGVTDGAIRAAMSAMRSADIESPVPDLVVSTKPPAAASSEGSGRSAGADGGDRSGAGADVHDT